MCIVDFHTHAFPDPIAEKAIPLLEDDCVKARLDGKISSLLTSMDANGIRKAVVCSIATKPEQFVPIFKWSRQIASERLVPFPSVHPDDPEAPARVRQIREAGLLGFKLHPYYQKFSVDEDRMLPIYEAAEAAGLILAASCRVRSDFSARTASPTR